MRMLAAAIGITALIGTAAHAAPIVYAASNDDPASIRASVQAFREAAESDRDRAAAEGEHDRAAAEPSALRLPDAQRERVAASRDRRGVHAGTVQAEEPADRGLFAPFSASRLFAPLNKYVAGAFMTVPGTSTVLAAITRLRPLLPDIELLAARPLELLDDALDQPLAGAPAAAFDAKLIGVAYR